MMAKKTISIPPISPDSRSYGFIPPKSEIEILKDIVTKAQVFQYRAKNLRAETSMDDVTRHIAIDDLLFDIANADLGGE